MTRADIGREARLQTRSDAGPRAWLGARRLSLSVCLALLGPPGLVLLFGLGLRAQGLVAPDQFDAVLVALSLSLAVAAALGLLVIARSERQALAPVERLRETVAQVSAGNYQARSGLSGNLAFERLGEEFDTLLDDRVAGLEQAARESEELNDSVIAIMQAVGTIAASKDLTLRVPPTDNVTGAIAEALNLLIDETCRVLTKVRSVAQDVVQASIALKEQSDSAGKAAVREQREVDLAARELATAASALAAIADRARSGNEAAERAVLASARAMGSVADSVRGVARSRELVRETEKRIKRLGERSQEIGQVVGIIQEIAERTGLLALNASMQAAAAGEAGRSFAGVTDEVKRLSASARESTQQIARLVTAIQTEAHDTVIAMNHAIVQAVEISRLADASGEQMRLTQEETEALAADVRDIARTCADQARVGIALQERARIIQEASGETARQLALQVDETLGLVDSARELLDEVSVFKVSDT